MKPLSWLKPKSLLLLLTVLVVGACNSSDDVPPGNPLAGIDRLNIQKGNIRMDGTTYSLEDTRYDEGDEGEPILTLLRADPEIQLSVTVSEDFAVNGQQALLYFGGKIFFGEDLNVTVLSDGYQLTGSLVEINGSATRQIDVFVPVAMIIQGSTLFEIEGNTAFVNGTLGAVTYNQILDLAEQHPNVRTLVLQQMPGSINDAVNVETGRLIRKAGYATHVPADGTIASGAVDLFCAGTTRTAAPGAKLGVHAWCCYEGQEAGDLPRNSPGHQSQLEYFREMLGDYGEGFYFFTIQAAPFSDVHILTPIELQLYGVVTQ